VEEREKRGWATSGETLAGSWGSPAPLRKRHVAQNSEDDYSMLGLGYKAVPFSPLRLSERLKGLSPTLFSLFEQLARINVRKE